MKLLVLKYKGAALLVAIAIVTIAAVVFYGVNNFYEPESGGNATGSPISVIAISLLSPLSPISPAMETARLTPAELEVIIQQGISLYQSQDYQRAITKFGDVLRLDPNNILAYNGRGTVYTDLKEYDKALQDYTKAIEAEPLFPHAYYNRGRVYTLLKKYDEAILDLQKSVQLSPTEFGYRANGNIGLIYHQQGQYDKALEAFASALSYDDKKADTYYFRGETYTAMGDYQTAITDYQAAIQRFPQYNLAYQSLGYAYYKTSQFEPALEALNKALEIAPANPTAHLYLMLVSLAQNNLSEAKTQTSQAVSSLATLSPQDQHFILTRVLADLKTFAQNNPSQAKDVDTLINLIPEPVE